MPDLVVIVPSRGRPQAARELADAFAATCTADTRLMVAVDETDPALPHYEAAIRQANGRTADVMSCPSTTMVEALNHAASVLEFGPWFAVGFMGDDHRPRTRGWDAAYIEKLRELGTGMVFGDDLIQHGNLPTQIAMTSDIVAAVGWMAPPDLVHMYVDNWWLQLGMRTGCIRYLPDVVVEHVHPVAGKVEWDEGHTRVNHPSMYQRDAATFARLQVHEMPRAVGKVRTLRTASAR
jgi:hypothetical protein